MQQYMYPFKMLKAFRIGRIHHNFDSSNRKRILILQKFKAPAVVVTVERWNSPVSCTEDIRSDAVRWATILGSLF